MRKKYLRELIIKNVVPLITTLAQLLYCINIMKYFGMQVDSSGLVVYWTIFRSVLCDHFQVRRNIQENFGKLILKWYIEY